MSPNDSVRHSTWNAAQMRTRHKNASLSVVAQHCSTGQTAGEMRLSLTYFLSLLLLLAMMCGQALVSARPQGPCGPPPSGTPPSGPRPSGPPPGGRCAPPPSTTAASG
ncbi:uncharacterized protein LOC111598453 [Drosophila hydei]|uniref:Uncharacterized protein LOC111598453 n=1 Tax=Drosophila hydei TaxID=7224 RepID=A0A6J1LVJ4_DROHY|nr:uncharacterized protein LOC111598453 [Drosophila hydei]